MEVRSLPIILLVLLSVVRCTVSLDDLIAEETQTQIKTRKPANATEPTKKYSSKIRAIDSEIFGLKTSPKKSVLDFRIESEGLKASAAGNGKGKEDDEEEKTLAQQVADGKYGLIQNEIFPNGSKRPGIISYLPNPEVPKDTKDDFGGLDKDEIWLAEDHVLVLRGGRYPSTYNDSSPSPWPPIDNYVAPPRQVSIPKNPKIPPPFPIQLTDNGPLEIIRGENGSLPPRPPFFPPFPLPPQNGDNNTFPFPLPPGPLPPFLANLPPGAAFLPPPGNVTDFDEDDPSIYYPPRYDFYYPQDNTTAVPPGPLVPGIILPPPPNFFAPEKQEVPKDEENETDPEDNPTTRPPYIAPAYLPTHRKIPPRTYTKRPPVEKKTTTVTYIYPDRIKPKATRPPLFTSPIYVPNMGPNSVRYPLPSTSPRPHHITIPKNHSLKQDIFIITTEPPESDNSILDHFKDLKPTKATTLDDISPERHPLRSLIRPNVSVSYIGKVGHLPPSTAFPFTKSEQPTTESYPSPGTGHFITFPPSVTVTSVPIIKKIKLRPEVATKNPHATFYFYEEPTATSPTPAEENEVSISPRDQFLKENYRPKHIDFLQEPAKDPVYITPKKTRTKTRPIYTPSEEPSKLNAIEIENSGFSGLSSSQSTEIPFSHQQTVSITPPTISRNPTTDGPFIPSNYYATANPASIHFTPLDHSLVDDITMKYFTIFGQKLNVAGGTTPLTPVPPTRPPIKYTKPKIVHHYTTTTTTESPRYYSVTTPIPRPPPQSFVQQSTAKPRPSTNFEQFLKEITGEDQKDYIVTHENEAGPKIKKPKAHSGFNDPNSFPAPNFYLPYGPPDVSQFIDNRYRHQPSTTLRPVTDVDLQPQYFPQISSTYRPYINPPPRIQKPLDHNYGQFLQEVTYNGPNTNSPQSNLQYFDASTNTAVRQQYHPSNPKPISLENDVLVNYHRPLPSINPDAELIQTPYNTNSNIKVVQPPDLSNRNRVPYRPIYQQQQLPPRNTRPQVYEPAKTFFQNIPQSGYFGPQQPSSNQANAFVSYNLPGNGGHFYFLTPQAVDRSDEDEDGYDTVKRSDDSQSPHRRGRGDRRQPTELRSSGNTSQDFLRRRRKKP